MNLIINGFHEKMFSPLVIKLLKHFKVRYGHFTYTESKFTPPHKMEAIFHNFRDLVIGNYDVNWEELTPLDADLIKSMNDCEVDVLKMMDRFSLSIEEPLTYDDRKSLYLKHLRYWNDVLEKNKIDIFISSNLPHEVYDFVIYYLCKLKRIPTVFLHQTNILDTVCVMENLNFNSIDIQYRYRKLLKKYKSSSESEIVLSNRFKKDFESNTVKNAPLRFDMLRENPSFGIANNLLPLLVNLNLDRLIVLFKNPSLLIQGVINHIHYIYRIYKGKNSFKFYKNNTIIPDLTQKYVYFPLHMQPELSTSPMAGVYVNQILIAQLIAYHLPKNVYIYIKENPLQSPARRDIEFYKELLKISQVRLIPNTFDTRELTNNSLAVVTATGTVGLEALYRSKPVLMFGHNFYQYVKGVFIINNNFNCQQALNKILLYGFRPNIKDFKIFLKVLEDTTLEGYIDPYYKVNTCVNDKISNKNILQGLIKKINSIYKQ